MIEPQQGFSIDAADYRWGTLPGEVAGVRRLKANAVYIHHSMPCRSVFGTRAVCVSVSGPAADRPVLSLTYELAAPWWPARIEPDRWLVPLQECLGPAGSITHPDLTRYSNPQAGVACWARWKNSVVDINLSIYGGVRRTKYGRSAGVIGLTWVDLVAAAAPYLPAWCAASAALAGAAQNVAGFQQFEMPQPVPPAGGGTELDSAVIATRVLHNRSILETPASMRQRIAPQTLALWRSGADGQWVLSTWWDSVVLRNVHIGWDEIRPAKAEGRSQLSIGGWRLAMPHGTQAIAQAAAALKALPGVVVQAYEGEDT